MVKKMTDQSNNSAPSLVRQSSSPATEWLAFLDKDYAEHHHALSPGHKHPSNKWEVARAAHYHEKKPIAEQTFEGFHHEAHGHAAIAELEAKLHETEQHADRFSRLSKENHRRAAKSEVKTVEPPPPKPKAKKATAVKFEEEVGVLVGNLPAWGEPDANLLASARRSVGVPPTEREQNALEQHAMLTAMRALEAKLQEAEARMIAFEARASAAEEAASDALTVAKAAERELAAAAINEMEHRSPGHETTHASPTRASDRLVLHVPSPRMAMGVDAENDGATMNWGLTTAAEAEAAPPSNAELQRRLSEEIESGLLACSVEEKRRLLEVLLRDLLGQSYVPGYVADTMSDVVFRGV